MRSGEYTSHRPQGRGTLAPRLLVRFCPVGAVVAFDFGVTVEGRDQRLRLRRRSQVRREDLLAIDILSVHLVIAFVIIPDLMLSAFIPI
jgi:hypothetical protein